MVAEDPPPQPPPAPRSVQPATPAPAPDPCDGGARGAKADGKCHATDTPTPTAPPVVKVDKHLASPAPRPGGDVVIASESDAPSDGRDAPKRRHHGNDAEKPHRDDEVADGSGLELPTVNAPTRNAPTVNAPIVEVPRANPPRVDQPRVAPQLVDAAPKPDPAPKAAPAPKPGPAPRPAPAPKPAGQGRR